MSKPPKSTPHSDIDGVHRDEKPNVESAVEAGQGTEDLGPRQRRECGEAGLFGRREEPGRQKPMTADQRLRFVHDRDGERVAAGLGVAVDGGAELAGQAGDDPLEPLGQDDLAGGAGTQAVRFDGELGRAGVRRPRRSGRC